MTRLRHQPLQLIGHHFKGISLAEKDEMVRKEHSRNS